MSNFLGVPQIVTFAKRSLESLKTHQIGPSQRDQFEAWGEPIWWISNDFRDLFANVINMETLKKLAMFTGIDFKKFQI